MIADARAIVIPQAIAKLGNASLISVAFLAVYRNTRAYISFMRFCDLTNCLETAASCFERSALAVAEKKRRKPNNLTDMLPVMFLRRLRRASLRSACAMYIAVLICSRSEDVHIIFCNRRGSSYRIPKLSNK